MFHVSFYCFKFVALRNIGYFNEPSSAPAVGVISWCLMEQNSQEEEEEDFIRLYSASAAAAGKLPM